MRFVTLLLVIFTPVLVSAEGDSAAADVATGKVVYSQTCIACHGAGGKGMIPGVRDLTASDGALAKSDEELVKNISDGFQTPGSAMAMPPKGGNPTLTEEDVKAVLAYLRFKFGT